MSELSIILRECLNYTADFQLLTVLCQVKKETTKENKTPTIQCNAQGLLYLSFGGEWASPPASSSPRCLVLQVLGWGGHGCQRMSSRGVCYFQAENRQTPASTARTWIGWRWAIAGSWAVLPDSVEIKCHVMPQSLPPHRALLPRASLRNVFWKIAGVAGILQEP